MERSLPYVIIGIDVDGVLAKYNEALAKIVETAQGLKPGSLKPPTGWNFPNWGLTHETFRMYHTMLMNNIVDMDVYEDARETIALLAAQGHKIRIVTARGSLKLHDDPIRYGVLRGTVDWLQKHGIVFHEISFTDDKTSVEADINIEDSPAHLQSFIDSGRDYIIFKHQYNDHIPGKRSNSWKEIEQMIAKKAIDEVFVS